jgi:hypothetical protein
VKVKALMMKKKHAVHALMCGKDMRYELTLSITIREDEDEKHSIAVNYPSHL